MDDGVTRRSLLGMAGGALAWSAAASARVPGANDRIRVGLVGCGARGLELIPFFQKTGADVVAVCDLYGAHAAKAAAMAGTTRSFADHRHLIDLKDVDAVVVVTTPHWHTPIVLDALAAGKDVYVEKPFTWKPEEGARVIEAVRRTGRICQVGAQQRSGAHYIQALEDYVKPGKLGTIRMVKTWWPPSTGASYDGVGHHATPKVAQRLPADLDWKRYLGPLPFREWNPAQFFHYRSYLEFGGGLLMDKFVHWIDVVHMMTGAAGPRSITTNGGLYMYQDGRTAPDTIQLMADYGAFMVTFDNVSSRSHRRKGIEICGTKANLLINREHFAVFDPDQDKPVITVNCERDLTEQHVENFLASCRSRKRPLGDVEFGQNAVMAAHLGDQSYREKRMIVASI